MDHLARTLLRHRIRLRDQLTHGGKVPKNDVWKDGLMGRHIFRKRHGTKASQPGLAGKDQGGCAMEPVIKMNTMPLQTGDIDLGAAVNDGVRVTGSARRVQAPTSELKTLPSHPSKSADALFWSWAMPR